MAKVSTLVASSTSAVGVYVPVHVMLSPEVIAANVPFGAVTSASELKPVTASENTIVTVDVSPDLSAVSVIVNVSTVGAVVSIVKLAVSVLAPP